MLRQEWEALGIPVTVVELESFQILQAVPLRGRTVLIDNDTDVALCDSTTGKILATQHTAPSAVLSLTVGDTDYVLVSEPQSALSLWKVQVGREPSFEKVWQVLDKVGEYASCLHLFPDSKKFACGFESGNLGVYHLDSGELIKFWKAGMNEVHVMCNLTEDRFATMAFDNPIQVWKNEFPFNLLGTIDTGLGTNFGVFFHQSLGQLFVSGTGNSIRVFCPRKCELLFEISTSTDPSEIIELAPDVLGVNYLTDDEEPEDHVETLGLYDAKDRTFTEFHADFMKNVEYWFRLENGNIFLTREDKQDRFWVLDLLTKKWYELARYAFLVPPLLPSLCPLSCPPPPSPSFLASTPPLSPQLNSSTPL
jgi:WD40 repeat protein